MSVQMCSFLRILRNTALTSLVFFSSSAVYAMDAEDDPVSPSQRITYRTTFSDPYAPRKRSLILFDLENAGYDRKKPLEININHRTPDEKFSPTIAFFNDKTNKYCPIGKLPQSDDFTSTSYFVDLSPLYSYLLAHKKPKILQLSFQSGISDIHSVTLQQGRKDKKILKLQSGVSDIYSVGPQQGGMDTKILQFQSGVSDIHSVMPQEDGRDKKVLQSVILGDRRSEDQPTKLVVSLPEESNSNEWSTSHRVMPRPGFAFPDQSSLILLPDPAIFEALSQRGATQMVTFKRLMDKGASFSERLNVAAAAARYSDNKERALSLVGSLILNKKISHSERLEVAAVADCIEKGQSIFLLSKVIEKIGLPFSYRLEIAHSLGEYALFKLATDELNKLEDRVSATKYLEGAMKIIAARKVQRALEGHTPQWARPCPTGRRFLEPETEKGWVPLNVPPPPFRDTKLLKINETTGRIKHLEIQEGK